MSNDKWSAPQRLNRWEARLESLIENIATIGELSIKKEDYEEIKEALGDAVALYGLTKSTNYFKQKWPLAFVACLSFTAAYNKDRGYWKRLKKDLGIPDNTNLHTEGAHWGKKFLEIISSFQLEEFTNLGSGYEYVTPIRLHGGIPRYSLPDFFEFILLPSIEKSKYVTLNDSKALDELVERSTTDIFVDNVVKLYFKYGGQHAQDFFSKCRIMAQIVEDGEPLPSPDKLGLRPYIVSLFEDFLHKHKTRKSKKRLPSPRVTFLPHQPAFRILFPEVTIPDHQTYLDHQWRIRLFQSQELKEQTSYHVSPHRKGYEVRLESKEILLDAPYEQGIVEFGYQDIEKETNKFNVIRRWQFRFLPAPKQIPIIYFDKQGKPVRKSEKVPAEHCWLLYPNNASIDLEGNGHCIASEDNYWQPWDTWKAELWDLSSAHLLHIIGMEGNKLGVLPIVHPLPVPLLTGETRLSYSKPIDEKPLFIGSPPALTIPNEEKQYPSTLRMDDWSLKIESVWSAEPSIKQEISLSEIENKLDECDSVIEVPLDTFLGSSPAGTYRLLITRPDGEVFERSFRMWPDLEVKGLKPLFLPGNEGFKQIQLHFHLPLNTRLETREKKSINKKPIHLHKSQDIESGSVYSATIPPERKEGEFHLIYPKDPDPIVVPLSLQIPRLLWALRFENIGIQELKYYGSIQYTPLAEIEQAGHALLHITANLTRDYETKVGLLLTLPGKDSVLQQLEPKQVSQNTPRILFDTKLFLDTIRELTTQPFFDLALKVFDPLSNQQVNISCIRITRHVDVKGTWLQKTAKGNWVLHWHETNPLQHRRIYIWSLWQPWHDPIEIKLPDDPPQSDSVPADDWWMHELPLEQAPLVPGSYAIQFVVIPTYEDPPIPSSPPEKGIQTIQISKPEDRLAWIDKTLQTQPKRAFTLHFEKACIHHGQGYFEERDAEVAWCSSNLYKGSMPLIAEFYSWLGGKDPLTQRALLMKMYKPSMLRKLFASGASPQTRQDYLEPFLGARRVNPESAKIILKHEQSERLSSRALNILAGKKSKIAVHHIIDRINEGRFSDKGGFELLKSKPDFAVKELLRMDSSSAQQRLLEKLSPLTDVALVVYPGWWIHCQAGWGIIDRILDSKNASELAYFERYKDTPFLEVTLRPQQHPIRLFLDLEEKQLIFPDDDQLFMCAFESKCYQFISNDSQEVIETHNRAAHGGLHPTIKPTGPKMSMHGDLDYQKEPPDNTYM